MSGLRRFYVSIFFNLKVFYYKAEGVLFKNFYMAKDSCGGPNMEDQTFIDRNMEA